MRYEGDIYRPPGECHRALLTQDVVFNRSTDTRYSLPGACPPGVLLAVALPGAPGKGESDKTDGRTNDTHTPPADQRPPRAARATSRRPQGGGGAPRRIKGPREGTRGH